MQSMRARRWRLLNVAGVAALISRCEQEPDSGTKSARSFKKSTATALSPNDQNQYGAGMVNAEAAVSQAKSMAFGLRQVSN